MTVRKGDRWRRGLGRLTLLLVVPLLQACAEKPGTTQALLLLPDGQVELGGERMPMHDALDALGPTATTRIVLAGCATLDYPQVMAAMDQLRAAGYDRLSLSAAAAADDQRCVSGAQAPP